ncbi:type VI secretion system ImpA family N-terminal domain-containing protein [Actinobacillus vicugnae]|uniref:type VI secretion system ImpA family N-terminal domain-containing protein n=1 Tax=Actinobacillus vicugnae TaxID=2573093 RepID=UPI00142ED033|nr:type VI secretion system ImpA family N-terminal domain-containing protein [Actinobacillus vicugnae]
MQLIKNLYLGGSPADSDKFMAIREQINFANRPDKSTDWHKVETLSAQLLAENGVDLQTLAYYVVAKTTINTDYQTLFKHIELLAMVLPSYWKEIWPYGTQARITALNWLASKLVRKFEQVDFIAVPLKEIELLEHTTITIVDFLTDYPDCRFINLLTLIREKLAQRQQSEKIEISIPLLNHALLDSPHKLNELTPKPNVSKVQVKPQVKVQEQLTPTISQHIVEKKKSYKLPLFSVASFILGLIVASVLFIYEKQPEPPLAVQLKASSSPIYGLNLAEKLIEQAKLSETEENRNAIATWQAQQRQRQTIGQQTIQPNLVKAKVSALQAELLEAEKHKGSITISRLKTALYEIEKELNKSPLLEHNLFKLSQNPHDSVLQAEIEQQFSVLLAVYMQYQAEQQ